MKKNFDTNCAIALTALFVTGGSINGQTVGLEIEPGDEPINGDTLLSAGSANLGNEPLKQINPDISPDLPSEPIGLNDSLPLEGEFLLPSLNETRDNADAFQPIDQLSADEALPDDFPLTGTEQGTPARSADLDAAILGKELLPTGVGFPLSREGFRLGLSVFGNYDSNVRLLESSEEEDYFLTIAPAFEFRSGSPGVPGSIRLKYTPFIKTYANDSDLSTVDHSASVGISFNGSRSVVRFYADYGKFTEANRYVGGVVETENFGVSVFGSYAIAENSVVELSYDFNDTDYDDPIRFDSEVGKLQVSWLRELSSNPNLELGPKFRHSVTDSGSLGKIDSMAYLLAGRYKPEDSENGFEYAMDVGIETTDRSGGSDESDFTGSFDVVYRQSERLLAEAKVSYGAVTQQRVDRFGSIGGGTQRTTGRLRFEYTPNELWASSFGVRYESEASPRLAEESIDTLSFDLSLSRILQESSLTLGGSVAFSEYTTSGGAVADEDDQFYSAYLSYKRGGPRATLDSTLQWSENSGLRDWSRLQFTTGVNLSF